MSTKQHMPAGSFILEWWSQILDLPRYISPHWWLLKLMPSLEGSYRFVDAWVLGHFLGSILLFLATSRQSLSCLEWIAVRYGGIIVIEGFFYEVSLLVFAGYRKAKTGDWLYVLSHRRLVVTSLMNYGAMIFWFALFYRHCAAGFTAVPPTRSGTPGAVHPVLTWLRVSFATMTTFGTSPMAPTETWTVLLILAQSAIGISMALLIVVSFVRLLPQPQTRDRSEGPPPALYNPDFKTDSQALWRSPVMSSVTKESLAMTAAVGAFALGALSLLFGYLLLASAGAHTWSLTATNCLGGGAFVVIGVGLAGYGLYWVRRKSGAKELEDRRDP